MTLVHRRTTTQSGVACGFRRSADATSTVVDDDVNCEFCINVMKDPERNGLPLDRIPNYHPAPQLFDRARTPTAREKTEALLQEAVVWKDIDPEQVRPIADAINNLWEPILLRAYKALDASVPRADTYEELIERAMEHQRSLNQLKGALGL